MPIPVTFTHKTSEFKFALINTLVLRMNAHVKLQEHSNKCLSAQINV